MARFVFRFVLALFFQLSCVFNDLAQFVLALFSVCFFWPIVYFQQLPRFVFSKSILFVPLFRI